MERGLYNQKRVTAAVIIPTETIEPKMYEAPEDPVPFPDELVLELGMT